MAGMLEDLENQIDKERALAQQKKAEDAKEKAEAEAKKLAAQRKENTEHMFF